MNDMLALQIWLCHCIQRAFEVLFRVSKGVLVRNTLPVLAQVFTGLLKGEDLSRAFAAADVFVMPSDSETLGFVVLEAMASGVPPPACRISPALDFIRFPDFPGLVSKT